MQLDPTIFKDCEVSDAEVEAALKEAFPEAAAEDVMHQAISEEDAGQLDFNTILNAKVVKIGSSEVVLDVGPQE